MKTWETKEDVPLSVYIISLVCGSVFLLAGLLKAGDLSALYPALLYDGVPVHFLLPLSILVVAVELVVGSLLFACYRCLVFLSARLVLVTIFTGQLVWFLIGGDPPECGCFGKLIEAKLSNQTSIILGMVRNVLMGAAMGYGLSKAPMNGIVSPPPF